MMDDTPSVMGTLQSNQIRISDKTMIHELGLKGYGEHEGGKFLLKSFESLYLLYIKKLVLVKNKKHVSFDRLLRICQKDDPEILAKFLIYRDLRTRGYVVKDGFGFGSDFCVYERGQFGAKGAKFLIFGFGEGQQDKIGTLQKKIDQIMQMGKEPIIAVIERRGEIIYYKINKMNFYENKAVPKESFCL